MSAMRLLIATNIPSPYQVDFMNAVAAHPAFDLLVMYSYPKAPALLWEDQLPRIRHRHLVLGERPLLVPRPRAFTVVNRFRPDFVIVGGYYDPNFFAAALALAHGKRRLPSPGPRKRITPVSYPPSVA